MDQTSTATWGLAAVTLLLVLATLALAVVSYLQYRSIRNEAAAAEKRVDDQMAILARQADELSRSARASQAMADEMLQARKLANPLKLQINEPIFGVRAIGGHLCNAGDRVVILLRTQLLVGTEEVLDEPWSDTYLESGSTGQHFAYRFPFDVERRDGSMSLTLRVTAQPRDGLAQTRDFLYLIQPDGTPRDVEARRPRRAMVVRGG